MDLDDDLDDDTADSSADHSSSMSQRITTFAEFYPYYQGVWWTECAARMCAT